MSRRRSVANRPPITTGIERLSHDGRGISSIEGKTLFVAGALPEETCVCKVESSRAKLVEARVTEVQVTARNRVEPKCEAFGRCGGCCLQHLAYDDQLKHKEGVLKEQLQHFGKVTPKSWLKPMHNPSSWGYRHKARLGVRYVEKKGGALVGFRETNGRYITDMHRCEVLHPSVGAHIDDLRELIGKLSIAREVPQIEVAITEAATVLVVRHLKPFSDEDCRVLEASYQEHGWWIYGQSKGPDTVKPLYPVQTKGLYYELPKYQVRVNFTPSDFIQVNALLNREMVYCALELLELNAEDQVLDLFCGLGNFSLPIARSVKQVFAIEGDMEMVKRAGLNAKANGIDNVEFVQADLFEAKVEQWPMAKKANKLLLDPPRCGALPVVQNIKALTELERIVYVSCNPATLARDLGVLVHEGGFELRSTGIMDMFAHTAHVESIALLTR